MATPIKRIEKDFLLKVLYDERIPLLYLNDRTEYILHLARPPAAEIILKPDRAIEGLKPQKKLDLAFDYRGKVLSFSVEVKTVTPDHFTAPAPEFFYKNLDRSYSRVGIPADLKVLFTFQEDRFSLHYPKAKEFETGDMEEWMENTDPRSVQGLITQMASGIRGYASGYKIIFFKEVKPHSTEERVVAETGKALFLSSTRGEFPQSDPAPKKRIITEKMFRRYLESTGVDLQYMDDAVHRFIKQKCDTGIFSDAWVPILFQEYVIGYIHVWIDQEGLPPFDDTVLDTLCQFAKILAHSLKISGQFEQGRIKNAALEGRIMDISASGLLFASPHSGLSSALIPNSELAVRLVMPKRGIRAIARIVRVYKDRTMGYFGCRFLDMAPEDMRFLFEFLYGKPFTDSDAKLIAGQV
ncbi:MAG: PilZ domain-containing protein [Treponema sp.]|jgi:hypothetical protein|nr:PilZ domain-containing protein [Treponema sp.]